MSEKGERAEEIDRLYVAAEEFLRGAGFVPVVIGGTVIQRQADATTDVHNELVIKFVGKKAKAKR